MKKNFKFHEAASPEGKADETLIVNTTETEISTNDSENETAVHDAEVDTANSDVIIDASDPHLNDDRVVCEVTGCTNLNVRSAPNSDSMIFAVIPEGTKVHLIDDEHPEFFKIITDRGLIGYAMKKYFKILNSPFVSE